MHSTCYRSRSVTTVVATSSPGRYPRDRRPPGSGTVTVTSTVACLAGAGDQACPIGAGGLTCPAGVRASSPTPGSDGHRAPVSRTAPPSPGVAPDVSANTRIVLRRDRPRTWHLVLRRDRPHVRRDTGHPGARPWDGASVADSPTAPAVARERNGHPTSVDPAKNPSRVTPEEP